MKHLLWVNGSTFIGGAERAQLVLFEELRKTFSITVVLPEEVSPGLLTEVRKLDIPHLTAPLISYAQTLNGISLKTVAIRCARSNAIIKRVLSEKKIDLIHVAHVYDIPFSALAARLAKVPLVWLIENPERFNFLKTTIINGCRLKACIGTSTTILNETILSGIRAPVQAVIPNSFDDRVFWPHPKKRYSIGPIRIGFAGVFTERKGVVELCRTFVELAKMTRTQENSDCELWLAGNGNADYKAEMTQVLVGAGILHKVRFFENLCTPDEMRKFYQDLDIYVMLSKREGLSVAMLEALACGVASAVLSPWGDDVIEDGKTGIILKTTEAKQVARSLLPLVLNSEYRDQMGVVAAKHVKENFSSTVVAKRFSALYQQVHSAFS